jgi:PIN domain nuclease of toxin-antitoxin system
MQLLLDTHTFLWFVNDSPRLSVTAKGLIESDVDLWVSVASLWEIAIKVSVGKLTMPRPIDEFIPQQIAANDIEILPIEFSHIAAISTLPFHHRDPFDRLLIAQSMIENVAIVSADSIFDSYGIHREW